MKFNILMFIIIICSISCSKKQKNNLEEIAIYVDNISFECNVYNISEEKKILLPHEMFIFLTVKNNLEDTIWFGSLNLKNDLEIRRYGYFQLIYMSDTIDMNSYYDISDILPSGYTDVYIDCYLNEFLDNFLIINTLDESKNIKSIFDKCELIYKPIKKDYINFNNNHTFLDDDYNIKLNNFIIDFNSGGENYLSIEYGNLPFN